MQPHACTYFPQVVEVEMEEEIVEVPVAHHETTYLDVPQRITLEDQGYQPPRAVIHNHRQPAHPSAPPPPPIHHHQSPQHPITPIMLQQPYPPTPVTALQTDWLRCPSQSFVTIPNPATNPTLHRAQPREPQGSCPHCAQTTPPLNTGFPFHTWTPREWVVLWLAVER